MRNPNCTRCGRKLTKPRLAANKRKCHPCEQKVRQEQRQRAHDRNVESEDFTAADYWQLYELQDGHCAIYNCRAQGKSKRLAVEHDHYCEMGHDKNRWCRMCVRGLTCSQHNEWIGRTGDDPDVFASLADYLRYPPARETLMDKMIVGTHDETIIRLNQEYKIPLKSARKMLDLARGVGPSPRPVPNGTITIRYVKIPRTKRALYEIIESAPRVDGELALDQLIDDYGLSERKARTALNSAWRAGSNKVRVSGIVLIIHYHGRSKSDGYIFSIEES